VLQKPHELASVQLKQSVYIEQGSELDEPHDPPMHVPPGQTLPHVPQLLGSTAVLTQLPPHATSPLPQLHTPLVQFIANPHAFPHDPQLATSVDVLTHVPPHDVSADPQEHAPPVHVEPVPQACPHDPQLAVSLNVLMHRPLHDISPVGHVPPVSVRPVSA
jgi:hypothetical protein